MNRRHALVYTGLGAILSLAFGSSVNVLGLSVTPLVTTTITGVNAPDATHISNAFIPMAIPLVFGGLMVLASTLLKLEGDFVITLWLAGFFMGSLFGMLLLNGGTTGFIPVAITGVAGTFLFLWIYRGAGRDEATHG